MARGRGTGGNSHLGASSPQEEEAAAKPPGVASGAQGAGCDAGGGDETERDAAPHCHCHQRGGRHGRAPLGDGRGKPSRLGVRARQDEMWRTEGISAAALGLPCGLKRTRALGLTLVSQPIKDPFSPSPFQCCTAVCFYVGRLRDPELQPAHEGVVTTTSPQTERLNLNDS
jgi:hypothetical protein